MQFSLYISAFFSLFLQAFLSTTNISSDIRNDIHKGIPVSSRLAVTDDWFLLIDDKARTTL